MASFVRDVNDDFAVANTVFERGERERDSSLERMDWKGGSWMVVVVD